MWQWQPACCFTKQRDKGVRGRGTACRARGEGVVASEPEAVATGQRFNLKTKSLQNAWRVFGRPLPLPVLMMSTFLRARKESRQIDRAPATACRVLTNLP